MTGRTVKVKRHTPGLLERLRLKELVTGLITGKDSLLRSWLPRGKASSADCPSGVLSDGVHCRGLHRLMLRSDGTIQCVACMLCVTHCPANCIFIVAREHPEAEVQKVPVRFEIDLLKCIFCGMCEETCPCDAIRLDTGLLARPVRTRSEAIECIEELLSRGGSSQPEANPEEH